MILDTLTEKYIIESIFHNNAESKFIKKYKNDLPPSSSKDARKNLRSVQPKIELAVRSGLRSLEPKIYTFFEDDGYTLMIGVEVDYKKYNMKLGPALTKLKIGNEICRVGSDIIYTNIAGNLYEINLGLNYIDDNSATTTSTEITIYTSYDLSCMSYSKVPPKVVESILPKVKWNGEIFITKGYVKITSEEDIDIDKLNIPKNINTIVKGHTLYLTGLDIQKNI